MNDTDNKPDNPDNDNASNEPDLVHIIEDIGKEIAGLFHHHHHKLPTGMVIYEREHHHHHHHHHHDHDKEKHRMSTVAGTSSLFQEAYTPYGSVPPSGTTQSWTVDVADITLTPSSDGTQCQVDVPAAETATSYNLTCTSSYTPPGAPTPISATVNVAITPSTPPTPTGMEITQIS